MPPVVALVGAAASVAGGMAAVGGTMAGFAAAGLGTQLVAGALIAGGVMTGLGVVTGNKKLQKWGGVLSLAGGVAGLAAGAWSSTASTVAEGAARESFRAAELGAQAAGDAAGAVAGGLADSGGGVLQANLGVSDIGVGAASAGAAPQMAPGMVAPTIPKTVNLGSLGGVQGTAGGAQGAIDVAAQKLGDVAATGKGMLSDSMAWMEKNPKLTQAGAGLLTAGLSGYAQQQAVKDQMQAVKDQMQAQEDAQARARKRLNDSIQGMAVPVYQRKGG